MGLQCLALPLGTCPPSPPAISHAYSAGMLRGLYALCTYRCTCVQVPHVKRDSKWILTWKNSVYLRPGVGPFHKTTGCACWEGTILNSMHVECLSEHSFCRHIFPDNPFHVLAFLCHSFPPLQSVTIATYPKGFNGLRVKTIFNWGMTGVAVWLNGRYAA